MSRNHLSRAHVRALLALGVVLAPHAAAQALSVTATHPTAHTVGSSTATSVEARFDAAVDPTTLDGDTFRVFGRWSGVVEGTLSVGPGGTLVAFEPARPFFPGERVTVMLSSAVQSTNGLSLVGGYAWSFWTTSSPGSGVYALEAVLDTRLEGEGLIQSYGIYAGDLDRDGSPDFSIPNEAADDVRVMTSDGCGSYSVPVPHALPAGSVPSSNEGQDFDGDGSIDLATANIVGNSMSVLLGDGSGTYLAAQTQPSGLQPRGLAVLDVEGDGDVDVAVANRSGSNVSLHVNDGSGAFAPPVFVEAGGTGETAIGTADADLDGVFDLLVGHFDSQNVTCVRGDGAGGFAVTDAEPLGGRPWMIAVGDVDGDGDVDVATCNWNTDTASVVRGDGAGGLHGSQSYATGDFPLAVDLGDLDGDGDLELVTSNYSSGTWTVYDNDGTGAFSAITNLAANQAGSCATLVDYDRDGDLDVVGIDEVTDEIFLYAQVSPPPAGLQAADCAASLRIDNLAGHAGYGAQPPTGVSAGARVFLGFSGGAGAPAAYFVGPDLGLSLPTVAGFFSVQPNHVGTAGPTDVFGEALEVLHLPAGLPVGFQFAVQGVLLDPGAPAGVRLTNPEQAIVSA